MVFYSSVGELIRHHKAELVNPEEYLVGGVYRFHGEMNPFTGLFEIDCNGRIVGEIDDPNPFCSRYAALGNIRIGDEVLMDFVKVPSGLLAPIYYLLVKLDGTRDMEGSYAGKWELREIGIKTDLSGLEDETENRVEMTLSRKQGARVPLPSQYKAEAKVEITPR